ncbi:hypothetical protein NKH98_20705 [Mesorhizobium sp. M0833]|uniref:hypothetical protein n=1 Tax=Mesorhizobium sp. M0833 TaxID=2957009 RepID=UPI0033384383
MTKRIGTGACLAEFTRRHFSGQQRAVHRRARPLPAGAKTDGKGFEVTVHSSVSTSSPMPRR